MEQEIYSVSGESRKFLEVITVSERIGRYFDDSSAKMVGKGSMTVLGR